MGLKSVGCKEESELWKRVLDEELMMRRRRGGGRGVHVVSLYLESSLVGNGPLQGIAGRECEERGGHER